MKHPNRITAGILALVLGWIGIQHFYTGQIFRGVFDVLFCVTVIPAAICVIVIPATIGIIEAITWLTDNEDDWNERVLKWNR